MVDSYGTTLGLWKWMHKQYSRLVQVKASKRLGSDQLESDNSHQDAMSLTNIECKHEQDIITMNTNIIEAILILFQLHA